jgi:hypothetical protein
MTIPQSQTINQAAQKDPMIGRRLVLTIIGEDADLLHGESLVEHIEIGFVVKPERAVF